MDKIGAYNILILITMLIECAVESTPYKAQIIETVGEVIQKSFKVLLPKERTGNGCPAKLLEGYEITQRSSQPFQTLNGKC